MSRLRFGLQLLDLCRFTFYMFISICYRVEDNYLAILESRVFKVVWYVPLVVSASLLIVLDS